MTSSTRALKTEFLKEENRRLRELLHLDEYLDEESWGAHAPQSMRDQYAASALISEGLHPIKALVRLGFKVQRDSDGKVDKRLKEIAKNIFETEGVKRILEADVEKFSANKEMVMSNLHRIATSPLSADSDKVRAAGQLSKMVEGWQDGEKGKNPVAVLNFLAQIVGGAPVSANGDPCATSRPRSCRQAVIRSSTLRTSLASEMRMSRWWSTTRAWRELCRVSKRHGCRYARRRASPRGCRRLNRGERHRAIVPIVMAQTPLRFTLVLNGLQLRDLSRDCSVELCSR